MLITRLTKLCSFILVGFATTVQCGNSECKEEIPRKCDFIVVGVGCAGSVIASRLSENRHDTVCAFESGTSDTDQPLTPLVETPRFWTGLFGLDFSDNYTTVPQPGLENRTVRYAPGRVIGGTSTVNGMTYFRGFKADFDRWAANGATGWSYNDVLPFFLKSENNTSPSLKDSVFHNQCGPLTVSQNPIRDTPLFQLLTKAAIEDGLPEKDCNEPSPFGTCQFQWTIRSGVRESSASAFLRPAIGRKNLFVFTEALVEKVLITSRKAYGIVLIKNGRRYVVHANKEVIVSGGTFESAALLQRSGIGPRRLLRKLKIRQHADLPVGDNYHDHVFVATQILANISTNKFEAVTENKVIKEYVFKRTGLYAQATGLNTIFLDNKVEQFNRPELQFAFTDGLATSIFNPNDLRSDEFILRNNSLNGTLVIVILTQPKSRGTIRIKSTDPNDKPIIDPNYLEQREDLLNLVKGLRYMQRFVQLPSMTEVGAAVPFGSCEGVEPNSDEDIECITRLSSSSQQHPAGSCKMGRSRDPSTVVDPKLRVKGIQGLRVADGSIMPDIVSTYPQGTIIMIGERAADFIIRDHKRKYK